MANAYEKESAGRRVAGAVPGAVRLREPAGDLAEFMDYFHRYSPEVQPADDGIAADAPAQ